MKKETKTIEREEVKSRILKYSEKENPPLIGKLIVENLATGFSKIEKHDDNRVAYVAMEEKIFQKLLLDKICRLHCFLEKKHMWGADIITFEGLLDNNIYFLGENPHPNDIIKMTLEL